MTRRTKKAGFNEILADLEAVVEELENNEQPLEESLKAFEKGIALTKAAQKLLAQAEQKVMLLTESASGEPLLEAFEDDEGDEDEL